MMAAIDKAYLNKNGRDKFVKFCKSHYSLSEDWLYYHGLIVPRNKDLKDHECSLVAYWQRLDGVVSKKLKELIQESQ